MLPRSGVPLHHGDTKQPGSMLFNMQLMNELEMSPVEKSIIEENLGKKKTRAQLRAHKHGPEKKKAFKAEDMTFLEKHTVTVARVKSYQQACKDFNLYCIEKCLHTKTLKQVDAAAAHYLDHLFFHGATLSSGMTLMASISTTEARCQN